MRGMVRRMNPWQLSWLHAVVEERLVRRFTRRGGRGGRGRETRKQRDWVTARTPDPVRAPAELGDRCNVSAYITRRTVAETRATNPASASGETPGGQEKRGLGNDRTQNDVHHRRSGSAASPHFPHRPCPRPPLHARLLLTLPNYPSCARPYPQHSPVSSPRATCCPCS